MTKETKELRAHETMAALADKLHVCAEQGMDCQAKFLCPHEATAGLGHWATGHKQVCPWGKMKPYVDGPPRGCRKARR